MKYKKGGINQKLKKVQYKISAHFTNYKKKEV